MIKHEIHYVVNGLVAVNDFTSKTTFTCIHTLRHSDTDVSWCKLNAHYTTEHKHNGFLNSYGYLNWLPQLLWLPCQCA